jgi:tetratricopeptide (TPR) repeat protein
MNDVFGGADTGGAPAAKSIGMDDIFGDAGSGAGAVDSPFHGTNSVVNVDGEAAGDGVLDFIGGSGEPGAAPKEELYRIRKRSGRVLGPFDVPAVLAMFEKQELMGNEDASTDGVNWRPLAQIPVFANEIQKAMAAALSGLGIEDDSGQAEVGPDGLPQEVTTGALLEADKARERIRLRVAQKGGFGPVLMALGSILLLGTVGGLSLEFFTDHGWFAHKWVKAKYFPEEKGPEIVDVPEDLALPEDAAPAAILIGRDSYVSYRQGAERNKKRVDAGKAALDKLKEQKPEEQHEMPKGAQEGATEEARFLAYLIHVEGMTVFEKRLREFAEYRSGEEWKLAIGNMATSLLDGKVRAGLKAIEPHLDPARGYENTVITELFNWAGIAHLARSEHAKAAKAFDQALVANPHNLLAATMQAKTLLAMGEADAAKGYYEKVLNQDPDHPRANLGLGLILIKEKKTLPRGEKMLVRLSEGELKEAAAPVQRAAAFMGRAEILLSDRLYVDALQMMNRAVEHAPKSRDMRLKHGELALKLREFATAKKTYEKLVKMDGKDVAAIVGLARAKLESGDGLGGYTDLQMALREEALTKNPKLHHWFGIAAKQLLKMDQALAEWKKARELDEGDALPAVELIADDSRGQIQHLRQAAQLRLGRKRAGESHR